MNVAQKRRRSGGLKAVVGRRPVPKERESGVRLRGVEAPVEASVEELRAIASATQAAYLGFEVCARRAATRDVAERMTWLADEARAIAASVGARVPGGLRRPSTSERMRWEWLASTAALLDGGAEGRLAEEASRHLLAAAELAARADEDGLLRRIERLAATSRPVAA